MKHIPHQLISKLFNILILCGFLYVVVFLLGQAGFNLIKPMYIIVINFIINSLICILIYLHNKKYNLKIIFLYYILLLISFLSDFFGYFNYFNILLILFLILNIIFFIKNNIFSKNRTIG